MNVSTTANQDSAMNPNDSHKKMSFCTNCILKQKMKEITQYYEMELTELQ